MDSLWNTLVIVVIVHSAIALDISDSDENAFKQSLLNFILRHSQQEIRPQANIAPSWEELYRYPVDSGFATDEQMNTKTKRSFYRLNRPINSRQTRLASFGTPVIPKHRAEHNSAPVLRYG